MKYLICLFAILTACGNTPKSYLVGTDAEFPPFGYFENGVLTGYDIEFFEALAKEEGIEFKWVPIDFKGIIPALESKKIDIIVASMEKTEDRAKSVLFTDAYGAEDKNHQLVGLNASANLSTGSLDEVKGKKVGVVLGHRADTIASAVQGIDVVAFDNISAAFLALQGQKIDYVFADYDIAMGFAKENQGFKVFPVLNTESAMCMAVRLGNQELADKLNRGIATLKANGTYDALFTKYLTENK
ncbi:MAG: transporter substrate-binding domain-containing protein [Brevinema sp.]